MEHPISLQVAGLDKPKRKRGRPKKTKTADNIAQQSVAKEQEPKVSNKPNEKDEEEPSGKRKRKAPTRFSEAVQVRIFTYYITIQFVYNSILYRFEFINLKA